MLVGAAGGFPLSRAAPQAAASLCIPKLKPKSCWAANRSACCCLWHFGHPLSTQQIGMPKCAITDPL